MKDIMTRWVLVTCLQIMDTSQDFAKEWDFNHQTISLLCSQSNGLAEKYITICKKILIKAKEIGLDPLISNINTVSFFSQQYYTCDVYPHAIFFK